MRHVWLVLLIVVPAACFPAEASAFHFTNKVTMSATLTDNWTVQDTNSCGPVGNGSVGVSLTTDGSTRFRPYYSSSAGRPTSRKLGAYVLLVPQGVASTQMGPRKSSGTITRVDNTVPGPNTIAPDQPCDPLDKSGCGVQNVKSSARIEFTDFDPHHQLGTVGLPRGDLQGLGACQIGALQSWQTPHSVAGGLDAAGDSLVESGMLLKMPSVASVKRKRTTVLTVTDHKSTTTLPVFDGTATYTDDVTRTITVTIKRL